MTRTKIIYLTALLSLTCLSLGEASDLNPGLPLDSDAVCLDLSGESGSVPPFSTSIGIGGWVFQYSVWIAYPWWYRAYYHQGYCDVKYGIVTCYAYNGW